MPTPDPSRDPAAPVITSRLAADDAPGVRWPGWALGLIFLVVATGIALTGWQILRRQQSANHHASHDQLAAIAELKVSEIHRWHRENVEDAGHVRDAGLVAPAVLDFLAAPDVPAGRARVHNWMASLQRHYRYDRVVLLDAQLQPRLAIPATEPGLGALAREKAAEALQQRRVIISDLHRSTLNGQINMDLLTPLTEAGMAPVGVLLIEIRSESYLFPLIRSWPTHSATAESLLVRREGDEVVYLNELRHQAGTMFSLRVPITRREAPAVRAVLGEEGVVEGIDYRGVPVLAALRRIPDTPWFLVAKVDRQEVDAPLYRQMRTVAWAMGALIAAAGLGVSGLWRHQKTAELRRELAHRDRAAQVLRVNEEQLRSIYAAMTEMLALHEVVMDGDGKPIDYRIIDCNPTYNRVTGLSRERAVGALASELYGTGTAPFLEVYARVGLTGEPAEFESYFPPLQKHFAISVVSPRRGRFATVTTDITERKNADAALRRTQAILQAAMDQSTAGIAIADAPSGALRYVNDAGLLIRGGDRQSIVDGVGVAQYVASWQMLDFDGRSLRTEEVPLARAILFGETCSREFIIRRSENDDRIVLAKAAPIRDDGDLVVAAVVVFLDITERREQEAEREDLMRELTRKNEELEGMIYVASHDLRVPLVNVQGFGQRLETACTELLARGPVAAAGTAGEPAVAERIVKALRYIRTSADKMDGLISGLLRVSRVGRIVHQPQRVEMNDLVLQVLASMEIQIQQAGAVVRVDSLPACAGDPQLLGQVFTNLIDNAIKYRAPDRPLGITLSARTEGREVIYTVADTGLGIPLEHQNKIWEMFHRLHPEGPAAGEGLGLKIVRRILDLHRGRVWVESAPGQGSRFFVALPATLEKRRPRETPANP